jgi:multidrug efflux pump subunit AcrB
VSQPDPDTTRQVEAAESALAKVAARLDHEHARAVARPRMKHSGAIAWMAKNPVAANLLMGAFIVGGILMGTQLQQEVFPEVELDQIIVTVPYPGASPAEAEEIVSSIEQAVAGLDGVKRVLGSANEGVARVNVEIEEGEDNQQVLADVKNAVDRITTIPVDAERPLVNILIPRREVISLVFYGDVEESVLKELANRALNELRQRPGVTLVETFSVRPDEVAVEVPLVKLRELQLSLEQIALKIRAEAAEVPGGGVKTDAGEVLLRTRPKPRTGEDFANLPIVTTPLGARVSAADLGEVKDAFAEVDQFASYNGKPASMVKAYRVGDETPIGVADTIKAYAAEVTPKLPPGVAVATWNDMSDLFKQRLSLLTDNAVMSLILVLFVLGLFFEMRLAFWVASGIPTSILGSFVFLGSTDVSINMISMFAFIVTLGIVVDDAIVVGESIWHKREQGMSPIDAAIAGTKEVFVPVTFSVLTTVAAFTPMLFLPGTDGKFFVAIPAVVICVLLMSLIESFFVLPAHLATDAKKVPIWRYMIVWGAVGLVGGIIVVGGIMKQGPIGGLVGLFVGAALPVVVSLVSLVMNFLRGFVSIGFDWLTRVYERFMGVALTYRYVTTFVTIAGMMLIFALPATDRVRQTFFPRVELDNVNLTATLPFGAPLADSVAVRDRVTKAALEVLDKKGGLEAVAQGIYAQIGGPPSGMGPGAGASGVNQSHIVSVNVRLKPPDERPFGAFEFLGEWRKTVGAVPGTDKIEFSASFGSRKPIEIILLGDDLPELERTADATAELLRTQVGVTDVDRGFQPGKPQLDFALTRLGEAVGLTTAEVGRQVRSAFYGAEAVRQQRGQDELKVMVRLPEDERRREHDIENLILKTPSGQEIPFREAAVVTRGRAYTGIKHEEQRRAISVTADVDPEKTTANQVLAALTAPDGGLTQLLTNHPGVDYLLGGESRDQGEFMSAIGLLFIFALFAIFALIAIPLRSYLQGFGIILVIPMAIGWAILAHYLLGHDLSRISYMGILALSGVAVNDSIVLVDAANHLRRQEGLSLFQAMQRAGARRFRPIWLTSLTTFLGLAPMIFETSVQARFLIPMAIGLGFGVLFATISSLVSIPAIFLVLEDIKQLFGFSRGVHDRVAVDPDADPSEAGAAVPDRLPVES